MHARRARRRMREWEHRGLKRPTGEQPVGALPGAGDLGSPVPRTKIDGRVLTNGK